MKSHLFILGHKDPSVEFKAEMWPKGKIKLIWTDFENKTLIMALKKRYYPSGNRFELITPKNAYLSWADQEMVAASILLHFELFIDFILDLMSHW